MRTDGWKSALLRGIEGHDSAEAWKGACGDSSVSVNCGRCGWELEWIDRNDAEEKFADVH